MTGITEGYLARHYRGVRGVQGARDASVDAWPPSLAPSPSSNQAFRCRQPSRYWPKTSMNWSACSTSHSMACWRSVGDWKSSLVFR